MSELESIRSPRVAPRCHLRTERRWSSSLNHRLARSLTVNRANMGFWLVRDELIAWKMNACMCCKKLCRPEHKDDGYRSFALLSWKAERSRWALVHFTYPRSSVRLWCV